MNWDIKRLRQHSVNRIQLRNVTRLFPYKHFKSNEPEAGATSVGRVPSRFTDGNNPPAYGVLYAAREPETAAHEVLVSDNRMNSGFRVQTYDLQRLYLARLTSETLSLVNLTPGHARYIPVHRDAIGSSKHTRAQEFSAFVHDNIPEIDGFRYHSTLTDGECYAVFERSLGKLHYAGGFVASRSQAILVELRRCNLM